MLLAFPGLLAGCDSTKSPAETSAAATTPAAQSDVCTQVKGSWDADGQTCSLTVANAKNAKMELKASYPDALLADSGVGAALTDFVKKFFDEFGRLDDSLTRGGTATLKFSAYDRAPSTKSLLFTTDSFFGGAAHPNTALTSYVFDQAKHTMVTLTDLLCAGRDPSVVLPPLIRPYLQPEIDKVNASNPSSHPLDVSEFEPRPPESDRHTYVESYQTWVLDGDNLVLILPATRTGPVSAGLFRPSVPMSALQTVLRDGACAAA